MLTISIHVPREGHDPTPTPLLPLVLKGFQSTCPARGTTISAEGLEQGRRISIHVPREGHDRRGWTTVVFTVSFQSTCPARGTTR